MPTSRSRCIPAVAALVVLAVVLLAGCSGRQATLERPRVDGGVIAGVQSDGIWAYLGVPFAAPPVGELRWRPPQAVQPWSGVRVCDAYGPSCPQRADPLAAGPLGVGTMDEDCLYLNVWSPAQQPSAGLPVMVWFHGGSFVSGSSSMPLYNGEKLAKKGVVVVTVNYRLGPLGFLAHPALSAESPEGVSGNYGLMDQIAALEWVQRNIGALGGDPGRVTVFGESAGAISILYLLTSPRAEGLFQGAIVQSGILLDSGFGDLTGRTLQKAERRGLEYAAGLGAEGEQALALLRAKSPSELLTARVGNEDFLDGGLTWAPAVDGQLVPESPSASFARGAQHDVPVLVGSNADEGNLFLSRMKLATVDEYEAWLTRLFGPHADEVLALYPVAAEEDIQAACSRILTEMGFAATARFVAASTSGLKQSQAFLYQFSRVPLSIPLPGAPTGAFHGLEIPYVFGAADLFGVSNPVDQALSERIMSYWTSFASRGDPNHAEVPMWPAYDTASDEYLELGDDIVVGRNLYKEACDLADRLRKGGTQ